ncbi:MAG: hypothetical protein HC859_12470 [Bacteroidia bacterium]|nr:hypothetical protein [Bacteroidia bacterium]
MKQTIRLSFLALSLMWVLSSCNDDQIAPTGDDAIGSAAFVGENCGCPDITVRPIKVLGNTTGGDFYIDANRHFVCDTTYALRGRIRVRNSATLTIDPGTIVLGNSPTDKIAQRDLIGALIVEKTGAINAPGTCDCPIVMTSRKTVGNRAPGDWGGLLLAGNGLITTSSGAPTANLEGFLPAEPQVPYGGDNSVVAPSSTLQYVRIEFSGVDISGGNGDETNSVTMGGLQSSVYTMDHVQVSFGFDDGFEWFGGNIDAKYLFSFKTNDDDFDLDQGYAGNVQFGAAWRGPTLANSSGSNGFESDGIQNNATCTLPFGATTTAKFSNITLLGSGNGSVAPGTLFESAVRIREGSNMELRNSLIGSWPVSLKFTDQTTYNNFLANTNMFRQNLWVSKDSLDLGGCGTMPSGTTFWTDFKNRKNGFVNAGGKDGAALYLGLDPVGALSGKCPDFRPVSLKTQVDYAGLPAFFTAVGYRGAFGLNDVNAGWCTDCTNDNPKWMEFQPDFEKYTSLD